ncbi:MAG: cyclic nucleotide-binding domain-containing protein [Actinomycetia bacterium]|nr:cyclic nucleotide-binding domain-containing protein [Actinomycetes bacterium]MCP4225470.1 cyclic nucleotide-binding domain-containing protein [Actinomycetes bacterium]MCP5031883.1 cyclic nucleotide-binding domain-containing protein [Actinomycetes bacterium]
MFGRNDKLDTEWLAGVGFFDGFTKVELEAVASLGERLDAAAGAQLIDQGRVGDECFVIVTGTAAIHIRGEFVTTVGPGTMIGEMALVEHRPRNATVTAETEMTLVSFGTKEFNKLLSRSPNAHDRVMTMLHDRLAENKERDQQSDQ